MDVRTLIAKCKRAWARQHRWDALLEEAYSYALPHRNSFAGRASNADGELRMERIFDSTALISAPRAAGRIQRDLMPPYERCFILEPGPAVPEDKRDELAKQLEKVTELLHTVRSHSEFPTASHECYLDLLSGRCNMKMLRGDRDHPIRYISVPRAHVAIEEGAYGRVEYICQRRKLTVEIIQQEYPEAKIPASMLTDTPEKEEEFELDEITYREAGIWYSELIWQRAQARLWKTKYRATSPWIIARYMKVSGEHDGRGPLLTALPDIRTLNKTVEMLLMEAALAMSGVYTVTDDQIINLDTISIGPGMFLQVESNGSGTRGPSIKALATERDFNLTQLVLENLRSNVKKTLIDVDLPPETGAVRSPTEIAARLKDLQQDTGSAWGRLNSEWVVPIAQRELDILSDPAIGLIKNFTIDQLYVKIQVTSPLSRVQKLENVKAYSDWLTLLQAIGGQQLVALSAKIEDAGPYLAQQLGVSADQVRPAGDRAELQKMVAQIIAQAQMAQQQPQQKPQPMKAAA